MGALTICAMIFQERPDTVGNYLMLMCLRGGGSICGMGGNGELGDGLAVKFGMLLAHLDERARRLYLGSEALALEGELGRERALAVVAGAAGVSRATVRAG